MKKILVPTDFSETANKARDYAVQLAIELNAEIILLNTFHIPYSGASAGTLINLDKVALEESEKAMELQMEYLNSNYANVKVKTLCRAGLLVDSVKNIGNNNEVDLIVMGTTGASGALEDVLGSNTSALIGAIHTPIIAIPSKATINFPQKIVVANDLMETGEDKMFDALKEISSKTNSSIDFIFIVNEEEEANNKINRLKSALFDTEFDTKYHPFHFNENDNIEEGILDYIHDKDFDLLVLVAHQRNFWEKLFHKSISKSLVKHASLPILVLPD